MKACIRCGETKPLAEFYAHPRMADKHLNKCKDCCRVQARRRHYLKMEDPDWREAERQRGREKFGRLHYNAAWLNTEPEKKRAASASQYIKAPSGMEKHHWSYREEHWRDVIFLAVGNHRCIHRHMTYDPEHMQFRTEAGELLNTKARHIEYMLDVFDERDQAVAA